MAPSTPPNASNPEESPTAPVVAASVPPTPAPTVAISAPPASTGPSVTPAASTIPGPAFLQSTLPDSLCPEFSNLGDHRYYYQIRRPTIGFPDVSSQQEQAVLFSLSMFQALQHDLSIFPSQVGAALPTPSGVPEICLVPESIYGRVKLEMYPKPVQRRAVIRMWRSFPWKWHKEIDVKTFVSKQLNTRYLASVGYAEHNKAKKAAFVCRCP